MTGSLEWNGEHDELDLADAQRQQVTHVWKYEVVANDFAKAGAASTDAKKKMKEIGLPADIVRRAAVAIYEGEINMVIHANGGEITITVDDGSILMVLADRGPGIGDVGKAMEAGFSTAQENVRNLGFGAGMGLPNMKKYTDELFVDSKQGKGTTVTMRIYR